MLLKIALRNVLRHRARTAVSVAMIAGAITAIVLFRGFCHHILRENQEITIQSQYGHLQIATDKSWNPAAGESPRDRAFRPDAELVSRLRSVPGVVGVSARVSFFGMISNGQQSVSAAATALDPARETQMLSRLNLLEGRAFHPGSKFEVILGAGLQRELRVPVGASITLLSYTYDGSFNAIDAEVVGVFTSGIADLDRSSFYVPLSAAQRLLDTEDVERLVVMLDHTEATDAAKAAVAARLPAGMAVRSWWELSTLYQQIVRYANMQNLIVALILIALAFLAIANTVGMTIAERTGEIGTLRAMGDTRLDVFRQFLCEGLLLGLLGGIAGAVSSVCLARLVSLTDLTIELPGNTVPVLVRVDLLPGAFLQAFVAACAMTLLATAWPAMRATRLSVVEALKRNI